MNLTIDIIIFAVIALFLFLRLRSSLGEYNGDDENRPELKKNKTKPDLSVVTKPENKKQSKRLKPVHPDFELVSTATVHNRLIDLTGQFPQFDPYHFLDGAMRAYDMIVRAFENRDRATLESLLKPQLFKAVDKQIKKEETDGVEPEMKNLTVQEALISGVQNTGSTVSISVDFWSADPDTPKKMGEFVRNELVHDIWTFEKDLNEDNQIWYLSEIKDVDDE